MKWKLNHGTLNVITCNRMAYHVMKLNQQELENEMAWHDMLWKCSDLTWTYKWNWHGRHKGERERDLIGFPPISPFRPPLRFLPVLAFLSFLPFLPVFPFLKFLHFPLLPALHYWFQLRFIPPLSLPPYHPQGGFIGVYIDIWHSNWSLGLIFGVFCTSFRAGMSGGALGPSLAGARSNIYETIVKKRRTFVFRLLNCASGPRAGLPGPVWVRLWP